jgi:hypothetical protein
MGCNVVSFAVPESERKQTFDFPAGLLILHSPAMCEASSLAAPLEGLPFPSNELTESRGLDITSRIDVQGVHYIT